MVRLYIQNFGTVQKLFVFADTAQELEYQYNSLYNFNATSGDLFNVCEMEGNFIAYIWTNKKKMIKYFDNLLHNRYWLKTERDPDGTLFNNLIMKRAEKLYFNIKKYKVEPHSHQLSLGDLVEYKLGIVVAEK